MNLRIFGALRLAAVVALVAFFSGTNAGAATGELSGIDTANIDPTCKACDDFFQYANGGWIKSHPIPASAASTGAFNVLADRNQDVMHAILEEVAGASRPMTPSEVKLRNFYISCMDTAAIDAAGAQPIANRLAMVGAIADVKTLAAPLAALSAEGVGALFNYGGGADAHDARRIILQLRQGGLGLPDRDYYLKDDDRSKGLRAGYLAHVTRMFALLGDPPDVAAKNADTVLAIETTLAKNQLSRVAQRDPAATDHKMNLAQVAALAPNFDWATFFATNKVPSDGPINVAQPEYFKALSIWLASANVADVRTYLRWQTVHNAAPLLAKQFEAANFDFYTRTLNGVPEQSPRWQRCVRATDTTLSDALGQLYVAKTFPPSARAEMLDLVKNVKQTLRDDFSTLDWMSPQTRQRAIEKLDAFGLKIGYPDKWRTYDGLEITRTSYAANAMAAARFRFAEGLSRIGKTVDRSRWGMTAPTVNASYSPNNNDITFPAGILQPPFFNKDADMPVNYGGIGAVIGHESTHGFDDEGRKYGPDGNLVDLWAPEDVTRFTARADCVVKQYDALSPIPGVQENGKLVEGEAIADLGGVAIAYKAFEKWQAAHPRRIIDGFTPEQRFFMGFAQVWTSNQRPEFITLMAKTNVHAYAKFRVNATLSNMESFAKAFDCPLLAAMVRPPETRCQIW
jgi:putative endopeptidase